MSTVIERPYEFLVRWKDGVISGAHVGFETAIIEDGKPDRIIPNDVQPVAIGKENGFPLDKIMDQLHIDAIAAMDDARAAQKVAEDAAQTAKDAADKAIAEANAKADAAEQSLASFVSTIEAQLAPLKETNAKK